MSLSIHNLFKRSKNVNYSSANVVPFTYHPYLIDLNYIYSQFDLDIIMNRDKEIDRIFNCLLRDQKKNAILVGKHGVGKTCILQKLVSKVIKGDCPDEFKSCHFVMLDVHKIISTVAEKEMVRKIDSIIKFIFSFNNLILVIDQVHLTQASLFLSNRFSTAINSSTIRVIGLTTMEELDEYFKFDLRTKARLEIIPIQEPKPQKIYPMVHKVIKSLAKRHGIKISKEMVEYIISVSSAFFTELANPELTIDIVEKSMIYAKRNNETVVNKRHINMNFNFNYELYNQMSPEDKKVTAYHEAGHFIVNKLSPNIRNLKVAAISIVPAENFLGITTFEFEPEKQMTCNRDYYVDNIAVDLAGRVAEMILLENDSQNFYTSGASADLVSATNTARAIITKFGMVEGCGENMAYLGNYDFSDFSLLSEEDKKIINLESQKIIDEAFGRAKEILNDNKVLLDKISEELLKNEVLDAKDLNRICEEVKREQQ